jgi:glycosyltransferase involved in cell wall biosynthesis
LKFVPWQVGSHELQPPLRSACGKAAEFDKCYPLQVKIVALIPFRNEDWILETCLASLRPWVDELIGCDDRSTDRSTAIFQEYGGIVVPSGMSPHIGWDVCRIRQLLLDEGRVRGGTHFVCVDADEAITPQGIGTLKSLIAQMRPGQKLLLRWLALWKHSRQYRDDRSVWSNNYKDFIFCDDGVARNDQTFLAEGRTPGKNIPEQCIKVAPGCAAVLHFQFVPWVRFQMKQAWYRCLELIRAPQSSNAINAKYRITLDDPAAQCRQIPAEWLDGLRIPEGLEDLPPSWHRDAVVTFFDTHGVEFFEPLDIWHIPELADEFKKRTGRMPRRARWILPSLFRRTIARLH